MTSMDRVVGGLSVHSFVYLWCCLFLWLVGRSVGWLVCWFVAGLFVCWLVDLLVCSVG